jgi:hypothetical protein
MGSGAEPGKAASDAAQIEASDLWVVDDRVEHRRHGRHHRHAVFRDAFDHRRDVARVGHQQDRVGRVDRHVHRNGHAEDVKVGQRRRKRLARLFQLGKPSAALLNVVRQVALGQLRAFGDTRRAACVLQHRQVVHRHVDFRRIGRRALGQLFEVVNVRRRRDFGDHRNRLGLFQLERRQPVERKLQVLWDLRDDVVLGRKLRLELFDAAFIEKVGADGDLDIRVVPLVLDLSRHVQRVGHHDLSAQRLHRIVADDRLRQVR